MTAGGDYEDASDGVAAAAAAAGDILQGGDPGELEPEGRGHRWDASRLRIAAPAWASCATSWKKPW